MNYGQKENYRVKTQVILAFFDLLSEKPASNIKTSEIIRRSNIARATYYRNFFSQEDIIACYLERLQVNVTPAEENALTYDQVLAGFIITLKSVQSERRHFLLLYQRGFSQVLQTYMLNSIFDIAGDMTVADPAIYRLYFVTGAMYNLLIAWLERDTKESPEELASIAANFLKNGVLDQK